MKFLFSLIFLIICIAPSTAKSGDAKNFNTWSDITTIYQINEDWEYIGDQGIRGVASDSDFTVLYFRPSVRYQLKPWATLNGGVRLFSAFNDDIDDLYEIGPWQGIRFIWPEIGGYEISHYLRLEERMFWYTGSGRGSEFELRSRYQLGIASPTYNVLFKNGIYLTGSIELMWDVAEKFDDNFIDQSAQHQ